MIFTNIPKQEVDVVKRFIDTAFKAYDDGLITKLELLDKLASIAMVAHANHALLLEQRLFAEIGVEKLNQL